MVRLLLAGLTILLVLVSGCISTGECRFEIVESANAKISNTDDVIQVLNNNGWSLAEGFEEGNIREYDPNGTSEIYPAVLENKNIKYWYISAFKKIGDSTIRTELMDENGNLYKFFNCV